MEALTRGWRDAYRPPELHEAMVRLTPFDSLPTLDLALDRSVLQDVELLPKLPPLPSHDETGVDFLRAFVARSTQAAEQPVEENLEDDAISDSHDEVEPAPTFVRLEDDPPNEYDDFDNVLDDILGQRDNDVLATRFAVDCLVHLLHGRVSKLFRWSDKTSRFEVVDAKARLSGTTIEASGDIFRRAIRQGTSVRRLRTFCSSCRALARQGTRSRVVVATFVDEILEARAAKINNSLQRDDSSFCSIDRALHTSEEHIDWLIDLLHLQEDVTTVDAVKSYSGKLTLDQVWHELSFMEAQSDDARWMRSLLLQRLMQVVIGDLSAKLNNSPLATIEFGQTKKNVQGEVVVDSRTCPAFIPTYGKELLVECELNTKLLKLAGTATDSLDLQLRFSIGSQTAPARNHHRPLTSKLPRDHALSEADIQRDLTTSLRTMMLEPVRAEQGIEDELRTIAEGASSSLSECLDDGLIQPMARHAERLRAASIAALFGQCRLLDHLDLLEQVYFFANGQFVVKLTEKLFAGRTVSVGRGTAGNISVNSPDALKRWPPLASSVGVALRNIMRDAITEPRFYADEPGERSEPELLGHIGFRIDEEDLERDSETGVAKPKPVGTIDALSFLRFRYRPPPALQTVISASALRRFDQISQFLLILLRCQDAVERMARQHASRHKGGSGGASGSRDTSARLRIEMTHFVKALTAHALGTAACARWHQLKADISRIAQSTSAATATVKHVRHLIDGALDHIANACLLGRRAAEVAQLLRTCLQQVLDFSSMSLAHQRTTMNDKADAVQLAAIKESFSRNAAKFVRVCEAAAATATQSTSASTAGSVEHPLTGLAVRLQMNGYWS